MHPSSSSSAAPAPGRRPSAPRKNPALRALMLLLLTACTATAVTTTSTSPSSSPAPAPSQTTTPGPVTVPDWRAGLPPPPPPPLAATTTTTTTSAPPSTGAGTGTGGSASTLCWTPEIRAFIHTLLDPYGIPMPDVLTVANVKSPVYLLGDGIIYSPSCVSRSAIAHETGHYVHDRANGFDPDVTLADAAATFTGTNWLRSVETYPGIERAGHCVGYVLWRESTYTRCPDAGMVRAARDRVLRAAGT